MTRAIAIVLSLFAPVGATAEPVSAGSEHRAGLFAEIEFGEGTTRLGDGSGSQLGRIAAWANDNFDGLLVVDGHADARGPAAGNVRLSLQRARLVRDQLIAIGVDPTQIVISAFGAEDGRRARVAVWGTHDSNGRDPRPSQRPAARQPSARQATDRQPPDRQIEQHRRQARPSPRPRR